MRQLNAIIQHANEHALAGVFLPGGGDTDIGADGAIALRGTTDILEMPGIGK